MAAHSGIRIWVNPEKAWSLLDNDINAGYKVAPGETVNGVIGGLDSLMIIMREIGIKVLVEMTVENCFKVKVHIREIVLQSTRILSGKTSPEEFAFLEGDVTTHHGMGGEKPPFLPVESHVKIGSNYTRATISYIAFLKIANLRGTIFLGEVCNSCRGMSPSDSNLFI
jgi:hypothetical protein